MALPVLSTPRAVTGSSGTNPTRPIPASQIHLPRTHRALLRPESRLGSHGRPGHLSRAYKEGRGHWRPLRGRARSVLAGAGPRPTVTVRWTPPPQPLPQLPWLQGKELGPVLTLLHVTSGPKNARPMGNTNKRQEKRIFTENTMDSQAKPGTRAAVLTPRPSASCLQGHPRLVSPQSTLH